jgi:hypothetical protein
MIRSVLVSGELRGPSTTLRFAQDDDVLVMLNNGAFDDADGGVSVTLMTVWVMLIAVW